MTRDGQIGWDGYGRDRTVQNTAQIRQNKLIEIKLVLILKEIFTHVRDIYTRKIKLCNFR